MKTKKTIMLEVPQLGEGLFEVQITAFYKKPGDYIDEDEAIYELESDKATVPIESPYAGKLAKWLVEEGDVLRVGAAVGQLELAREDITGSPCRQSDLEKNRAGQCTTPKREKKHSSKKKQFVPPRTRAYAQKLGLSLDELEQISPKGKRIQSSDVDEYLKQRSNKMGSSVAKSSPRKDYKDEVLSEAQQLLNSRLRRSQGMVIASTMATRIQVDGLARSGKSLLANEKSDGNQYFISPFQVFAYCVAQVAREFQLFRSVILEDDKTVREYPTLNLGIAVHALENNLLTAVVEQADTLCFKAFIEAMQNRIEVALTGTDQATSSTQLILSYLGDIGVIGGSPLLISPAVGMLYYGQPFEETDKTWVQLSFTFDHRLINGMYAAKFLKAITDKIDEIRTRRPISNRIVPASPMAGDVSREKEESKPIKKCLRIPELTALLVEKISQLLDVTPKSVDIQESLGVLGMDSLKAITLKEKLESCLGESLPDTLVWHYPTVEAIAQYLSQKVDNDKDESIQNQFDLNSEATTLEEDENKHRIEISHEESSKRNAIAIVGVSFRLPGGVTTMDAFWDLLSTGKDAIQPVPENRWQDVSQNGDNAIPWWGGFLDDVDKFDAEFFKISPTEAELIDPQHRVFLETAWHALEDAGYDPRSFSGTSTGIFVGLSTHDYSGLLKLHGIQTAHSAIGISPSLLSNRVSYALNFNGPSETIDTACSSSLVALHRAIHSIRQEECGQAIVGGVNLLLSADFSRSFHDAGMLSVDGRCKTFDREANGYVRSEGVVALLIKSLHDAENDHDHVYGMVRASAVNHGGKAHSLTAPNPGAQNKLLISAYKAADLPPTTIGYIEAHGTGTELGDPIEVEALQAAFSKYLADEQQEMREPFCGLGSVKSNIGHLEAAAGLAGLVKVLACFKYQQIAPTIHFRTLNPHIHLEGGPFYIVQRLTKWERLKGSGGCLLPRRAGISSFGVGGTNAHVVIEEWLPPAEGREARGEGRGAKVNDQRPALIVLSAKNEERLKEAAKNLYTYLTSPLAPRPLPLHEVAYTLQIGREAMDERLAMIVRSVEELKGKLKKFIEGQDRIENLYHGQPKHHKEEILAVLATNDELEESIEIWISEGRYEKLLDLWVKGLIVDWNKLYGDNKPRRIGLPTYPFAKERYWISESTTPSTNLQSKICNLKFTPLHPLVHENTSDFSEQRYSSTFTGEEFFLADHVVNGQRILPAVAYIEMARAAMEQTNSTPTTHSGSLSGLDRPVGPVENQGYMQLQNVVWARPIAVRDEPIHVNIGLIPADDDETTYEIYSESEESPKDSDDTTTRNRWVVHSQGRVRLLQDFFQDNKPFNNNPALDLKDLQVSCQQRCLSPNHSYEIFKTMGINYGPGHRGLKSIYVGSNQVLAKLFLPSCISDTANRFVLHPSLLDSALQASLELVVGPNTLNGKTLLKPALPFALDEVVILGPTTPVMWALIRFHSNKKIGDRVQKFNIDLCNDHGDICVRMNGFSSRLLQGESGGVKPSTSLRAMILQPNWQEQTVNEDATELDYTRHLVVLCEPAGVSKEKIEHDMTGVHCLTWHSNHKDIEKRFESHATLLFEEIQRILEEKPKGRVLIQIVSISQKKEQLFAGLFGLMKTATLENSKLIGQMIEVESREKSGEIIEKLKENSRSPQDRQICYKDGKRWVKGFQECNFKLNSSNSVPSYSTPPLRQKGVYLITGGVGGVGLLFAKEIVTQVQNATVILTGRFPLGDDKEAKLKELEALGSRVEYEQIDVTERKAVYYLIQRIHEDFGSLHGIIHSAGVIRDNFILKKTKDELQNVLAPKVSGLVTLDRATKDVSLDFFVLFSSIAGALGNAGQADYACANAFMDAYARYRNHLVAVNQRLGQTLSINWPLWNDGGMQVDETIESMMRQSMGMVPMQTSTGIRSFYQGLASGQDQVMVIEGDPDRFRTFLAEQLSGVESFKVFPTIGKRSGITTHSKNSLQRKAVNYITEQLSAVIKLPANRLEADAPLEKYGIDSIMSLRLTNQLEKVFGSLPKTLFFEHQNIQELSEYFLESYPDRLKELLGIEENKKTSKGTFIIPSAEIETVQSVVGNGQRQRIASLRSNSPQKPKIGTFNIAIIGLSGRYPQARTVVEFWENLRDGKDCITEIPNERWDHSLYFDADKDKPGKTYSKWGGFIDGVDEFDPLFFNISPREAELMDPQERLFLECVFETLEDAGYTRDSLRSHSSFGSDTNVGIYVGVMYEEYQLYGAQETIQGRPLALSGSPSSIANRVSYFCNFHGPSMAIDTMCSSSLSAIHLACQGLKLGETELAIAGGVNVSIHPNKYLMLGRGNFVSSKGRCESFGQGGDGYVPGEGVGAILLKSLSKAVTDGDHIYGIIKGTALNHGGKTNGYTVPNPKAQAGVISRAFKESGIDPRTISYLEAHGTGTSLGDPIEIAGLNRAFKETETDESYKGARDPKYCAIGSAKSNIGHCESAAGIAGVTKVLLQLKHGQLVPSLHSKTLNPNIDFSNTLFVVQQELAEWKRPAVGTNGESKEFSRRAGISSFGAGGSNAHIIIEEYIPEDESRDTEEVGIKDSEFNLFVLSAKAEGQLKELAKNLCTYLTSPLAPRLLSLNEVAYTLQVGREAMEVRLAVIANDIEELIKKLERYLGGDPEGIFCGFAKGEHAEYHLFNDDDDVKEIIDRWINTGKLEKIAAFWVKGTDIDWHLLPQNKRQRRISLPTYPFARERYWISHSLDQRDKTTANFDPPLENLYPEAGLENGIILNKVLRNTEPVLNDHRVNGRILFPGTGHVALVYEAIYQITKITNYELNHLYWRKPIYVENGDKQVRIFLKKNDDCIRFELRGEDETQNIIYSTGEFFLPEKNQKNLDQRVSIDEIKRRCISHLNKQTFYDRYNRTGLNYGPYFQLVEEGWANNDEALSLLQLPAKHQSELQHSQLHPALLDSALHTALMLELDSEWMNQPHVPFALEKLEIFHPLRATMYSYIRKEGKLRYHVAILDEVGKVCVKIHGMGARPLSRSPQQFFYLPQWTLQPLGLEQDLSNKPDGGNKSILIVHPPQCLGLNRLLMAEHKDQNVYAIEMGTATRQISEQCWEVKINDHDPFDSCIREMKEPKILYFLGGLDLREIPPDDLNEIGVCQDKGVIALLKLIKSIKARAICREHLEIKVITNDVYALNAEVKVKPFYSSLHGLTKVLTKENPQWKACCLDIHLPSPKASSSTEGVKPYLKDIVEVPCSPKGDEVILREGRRYVRTIRPILLSRINHSAFRSRGVYLIVGGAGSIGFELSLYLARTYEARLVVIGRSELDSIKEEKLAQIRVAGGKAVYLKSDVSDLAGMKSAVAQARSSFGNIHGVIHSAIAVYDKSIFELDEETFRAELNPKTFGSVVLYKLFKDEPLDFFMFFSSASAFAANKNQSGYVAGCIFTDSYGNCLDQQTRYPVKIINWGYWTNIREINRDYSQRLRAAGIQFIEYSEGVEAIERILGSPTNHVLAVKANPQILEGMGVDLEKTITMYPQLIPIISKDSIHNMTSIEINRDSLEKNLQGFIELEELSQTILLNSFRRMGILLRNDERYSRNELKDRLNILPKYTQLFNELLKILASAGFIELEGDAVFIRNGLDSDKLKKECEEIGWEKSRLLKSYPQLKPFLNLVEVCVNAYPEVLTGKQNYMELLFPDGSMGLVEGIYKGNELIDFHNHLVSQIIKNYIAKRLEFNSDTPIRILEVGSGTGGTSSFVLNEINGFKQNLEFYYTDISQGFVEYGSKKFGDGYSFVKFQKLNIAKSPATQNFEPGSFDLIFASNVIHATKQVKEALGNVKKLLRTNGLLILNEATQKQNFTTLTFGMTDEWWSFNDEDIRLEGTPLLSPKKWKRILQAQGFYEITILGTPETSEEKLIHSVIVGKSDGLVIDEVSDESHDSVHKGSWKKKADPEKPENEEGLFERRDSNYNLNTNAGESLEDQTILYIKNIFSRVLKLDVNKIDNDSTFDKYGVDSLVVIEIAKQFEPALGKLPATLLFEQTTVRALSKYFIKHHRNSLENKFRPMSGDLIKDTNRLFLEDNKNAPTNNTVELSQNTKATEVKEAAVSNATIQPAASSKDPDDIAIIGVSGRYPKSNTLMEFWENLVQGRDCICEIPQGRWDWKEFYDPDHANVGKCCSRWGGFISDIDKFDPLFFNISPREAEFLDPQCRLFLESVWHTLEDAGYTKKTLNVTQNQSDCGIGVFVGAMYQHYPFASRDWQKSALLSTFSNSSIANRVSYFLNLGGPSIAVDTACSSSLTAIHMACESLKRGECLLAFAGGVNLSLHPYKYVALDELGLLSSSRHSKSLGDADGFIPGEGVGCVLLKPLSIAIKDKDQIYGVIKGSFVNHGGKTQGLSVPNPNAQADLIAKTLNHAGIDPRTISYVELASNGSHIGDPIEIAGLNQAFERFTKDRQFCPIGSVKPNIGHLEAASGISQLTKVLLQLKHYTVTPIINAEPLNPNVELETTPFYIQKEPCEWTRPKLNLAGELKEYPRRAAISAFGAGGSYAHVIVEEFENPVAIPTVPVLSKQIIVLSAKSRERLVAYAGRIVDFLESQVLLDDPLSCDMSLTDFAYTLQTGREALEERLAVVISDWAGVLDKFRQFRMNYSSIDGLYAGNMEEDQNQSRFLFEGEEREDFVKRIISKQRLDKLALLWVSGVEINWNLLYPGELPNRIHLPTYPFSRDRYWISENETTGSSSFTLRSKPKIGIIEPEISDHVQAEAWTEIDQITQEVWSTEQKLSSLIKVLVSSAMNLKKREIDDNKPLSIYGINSITTMQIINELQTHLQVQDFTAEAITPDTYYNTSLSIADISQRILKAYEGCSDLELQINAVFQTTLNHAENTDSDAPQKFQNSAVMIEKEALTIQATDDNGDKEQPNKRNGEGTTNTPSHHTYTFVEI